MIAFSSGFLKLGLQAAVLSSLQSLTRRVSISDVLLECSSSTG